MILDYSYSKSSKKFEISYIKEDGNKGLFTFEGVQKFNTYKFDEHGPYVNWDGRKCRDTFTSNPSKFDIRNFILDLPAAYQKELHRNKFPNLYTFDIENKFVKGEKADAGVASGEITTISICSPAIDCIVLGTRPLQDEELINKLFRKYVDSVEFFHELGLELPKFKYVKFDDEKSMLEWFLINIVSKVPVLSGWNCVMYDWRYIVNRIQNNYPELSIKLASYTKNTHNKSYKDFKSDKIKLPVPRHTFIVDMMDIIDQFDKVVMPLKESMKLDYISEESLGVKKIEYEGDLMQLYEEDYDKYVYYNCIDSVLVQLINYRFKTIQLLYLYGHYCKEKIIDCTSKIALTEALFQNYFRDNNIKIVWEEKDDTPRDTLVGAYVKEPKSGMYKFVTCNDFASLYPSTIITCNISIENMLPEPTIGPDSLGRYTPRRWYESELETFRKDPNYFVSVNGNVYRNDQDYAFKKIQKKLKADRNVNKYLAKKLDAQVMLDIEHIKKGILDKMHTYDQQMIEAMESINYPGITCGQDLLKFAEKDLDEFAVLLKNQIVYYESVEKSTKNLGNSMYGGSSHVSFFWFNMRLANDITGEARNLIHFMEKHLSTFWQENWVKLTDLHKKLGITVNPEKCKKLLNVDFDPLIYGDTDSLYSEYDTLLQTIDGYDTMTERELLDVVVGINTLFLNEYNKKLISDYFETRHVHSVHEFELETVARSGFWLDVKKRYAQVLLWKDGKCYDEDSLPLKIKGLELIQSSTPKAARKILKDLVRFMLESKTKYLWQELNIKLQSSRAEWDNAPVEDVSGSVSVNGYAKNVIKDTGDRILTQKGCPFQVKALAKYNWIINTKGLPDENIYGGRVKFYATKNSTPNNIEFFAYASKALPKWSQEYAPINRRIMFERFVLNPFNRIMKGIKMPTLSTDGSAQMSLF